MSLTKRYINIDFGDDGRPLRRVLGTVAQGNNKVNIIKVTYPNLDKNNVVVALSKRADESTGSTFLNYSNEKNCFELVLHNWFTAISGELQLTFAIYDETPEVDEFGIIKTETDILRKVYLNVEESINADLPSPENESIFLDIAYMVKKFDDRIACLEESNIVKIIIDDSELDNFLDSGIYKIRKDWNASMEIDIFHLFVYKTNNNITQIRTSKKGYHERTYNVINRTFSEWQSYYYNVDGYVLHYQSKSYIKGSIVLVNGEIYIAIADVPENVEITDTIYWMTLKSYVNEENIARYNLINKYFTINEEHDNVLMEYEYIINRLVVKEKADFEDGFYSNTTASGDTYSKGLSMEHDINQFSMFGYDYNYTDGTYYTNRFNFENGGNVRVAINNPTAKFTYNDKEVATEQDVAYLEKKIRNLQASAEGSTFVYEEDSNVSYEKDVPSGASPYAVVNKVGGMSYANESIYTGTFLENKTLTTDGTLSNGTNRITTNEYIKVTSKSNLRVNAVVSDGGDVSLIICEYSDNSGTLVTRNSGVKLNVDYTLQPTTNYVKICFYRSGDSENMYNILSNIKIYENYFEGIRNSAVTNIVSQGQNLFNLKNEIRTEIGYNIRCLNGEIYFSGKSNATNNIRFDFEKPLPAGTYTLNLFNNLLNSSLKVIEFGFRTTSTSGNYRYKNLEKTNDTFTLTTNDEIVSIFIGIKTIGLDLTNFTCYPMVVKGNTPATEFKSYKLVNKQLPNELLNLTNYGLGVNATYNNYVDFINKKYVRYCIPFYANGSETVTLYNQNEELGFYKFRIQIVTNDNLRAPNVVNANIVQNSGIPNYTNYTDYANNKYEQVAMQTMFLFVVISKNKASTVEEFKTWLTNNPITGVYALNIPIEEDISYLLKDVDEFIEVESLGTLTFENEHKQGIASTVTYQVKI